MLFEIISVLIGFFKIVIFKFFYFSRLKLSGIPKINASLRLSINKNGLLKVGKNFRCRNNMSFRISNGGILKIGNNCFFNDGCSISCRGNISIGNNVISGQNLLIFDHDHNYRENINDFIVEDVKIGNNVWIGANVIILKGVNIGDNSVIAAGTIINHDIMPNSLVYNRISLVEQEIKRVDKN